MREACVLTLHDGPTNDWAVIAPASKPAFVGGSIDWQCPRCGIVLAQTMCERQFLDLLFCCYTCGAIGATPKRQPGEPLTGPPALVPPGRYRLESTIDLSGKPVLWAGVQALNGYVEETGTRPPLSEPPVYGHTEISASSLRVVASEAAGLLGSRYLALRNADSRGQSSPTPPARRHRLIELITYAEATADVLDKRAPNQLPVLDGDLLSELFSITALFKRWRRHPAYAHLLDALVGGSEVEHTLMLLAVASYLTDAGNGIGIVIEHAGQRISDIWVTPTLTERLDLEIKTPQRLCGPLKTAISEAEAEDLIGRQLKKAASARSGQLSVGDSGILAFGGFHLGSGTLSMLCDAGSRVLASQSSRKKHLAALTFSELSYQLERVVVNGSQQLAFSPTLETRVVQHPGYSGGLQIMRQLPADKR